MKAAWTKSLKRNKTKLKTKERRKQMWGEGHPVPADACN
jgi:hypothetical protein